MGKKLLLYISFDGSAFCGYQVQRNASSVQGVLNRATAELFGYPCDITGCSRTDSGVHARMFCCTVTEHGSTTLSTSVPIGRIPQALCVRLPDTVSVWQAQWVPESFHPRYDVSSKEYVYRFLTSPCRDPFEVGRSWHLPCPLLPQSECLMDVAAHGFIGKYDFSACMAAGSSVRSTVRHVLDAGVVRTGNILSFHVRADGFLYNMVRIMAGTLYEVATGRMTPESIPERLNTRARGLMGQTAPPEGLYLNRVFYDDTVNPGYHGGDCHAG